MDPGFQARLQAGQTVLERSAAARGGAASGTALQDLNNYAQTQASSEFNNAYNRFLQTRQQNFDFANTVAGRGAATAGTAGQNLIGGAKYAGDTSIDAAKAAGSLNVGGAEYAGDKAYNAATTTAANTLGAAGQAADYLTQGANAQAAGTVGRANAITGAISSGVGALGSAAGIYNALKYPNRPIAQTPVIH